MKWSVLACNGMDKAEGALAREIGLLIAEAGEAEVVCPVLLNRASRHYEGVLSSTALIVIDGCGTRCASKLATQMAVKPVQKVLVSDQAKMSRISLETSLRLGPAELAFAEDVTDQVVSALTAQAEAPATPAAAEVAWEPPADYLMVPYNQFEFRVPREGYLFNENDLWVRMQGTRGRVGISDYLQQSLTDIYYFDEPELGSSVEQFGELGAVESSKAVFEIVAPVSGTVVSTNEALIAKPELINEDPYGEGWLVEVELSAWPDEAEFLLDCQAYSETLTGKAAEGDTAGKG
jgi:glycine cleavage system H protein